MNPEQGGNQEQNLQKEREEKERKLEAFADAAQEIIGHQPFSEFENDFFAQATDDQLVVWAKRLNTNPKSTFHLQELLRNAWNIRRLAQERSSRPKIKAQPLPGNAFFKELAILENADEPIHIPKPSDISKSPELREEGPAKKHRVDLERDLDEDGRLRKGVLRGEKSKDKAQPGAFEASLSKSDAKKLRRRYGEGILLMEIAGRILNTCIKNPEEILVSEELKKDFRKATVADIRALGPDTPGDLSQAMRIIGKYLEIKDTDTVEQLQIMLERKISQFERNIEKLSKYNK